MIKAYSYGLKRKAMLLDDVEFARLSSFNPLQEIKHYMKRHGVSLREAQLNAHKELRAFAEYKAMTGEALSHITQIGWIRASRYGRLCPKCGKPFRTPRAKLCAECGIALPSGEVAGPLRS